jgi:hypothetical protein
MAVKPNLHLLASVSGLSADEEPSADEKPLVGK